MPIMTTIATTTIIAGILLSLLGISKTNKKISVTITITGFTIILIGLTLGIFFSAKNPTPANQADPNITNQQPTIP